jgi:hypothetical protein
MNIIFLDVDGVLNCELFYQKYYNHVHRFDGIPMYKTVKKYLRKLYSVKGKVKDCDILNMDYYKSQMCTDRIGWLNELCEETGSVVVLSASMRASGTVEQLQEIFNYVGATFKIIDKTGHSDCRIRGCEIYTWIQDNIKKDIHGCHSYEFKSYAIIDDDSDMLLWQANNFFQTDTYSGLTPTICEKIKKHLLSLNNN